MADNTRIEWADAPIFDTKEANARALAAISLAEAITDSPPVLAIFASCGWEELHEDGKLWVAAIVAETIVRTDGKMPEVRHG